MNTSRIRELRVERGLTQEGLAELARIAQPTLSQYETGRSNPSLRAAKKIALALGVSVDALITSDETPPKSNRKGSKQ